MGAGQSDESDAYGWRVLKVMPSSPCSNLGLVPYFDVLTHVNKVRLTRDEMQLVPMIKDGVSVELTVLSFVSRKSRSVTVTPNRAWGGDGLLGMMIRYDKFEGAEDDVVHILDIYPGSPAAQAGLQAYSDYLLGTSKLAFKGCEQLEYFLEKNLGTEAQMFVFNSKTRRVREVSITPNPKWGGKGSLGCDVGVGLVHRLPVTAEQSVETDVASLLPEKRVAPPTSPIPGSNVDHKLLPVATVASLSPDGKTATVTTGAPSMPPLATSHIAVDGKSLPAAVGSELTTIPLTDTIPVAAAPSTVVPSYVPAAGVPFPTTLPAPVVSSRPTIESANDGLP